MPGRTLAGRACSLVDVISMSRKGNPWDNAACESSIKILKYEEVLRNEYRDLAAAHASIQAFIEKVYNQKRPHSALGYLPPASSRHNWQQETWRRPRRSLSDEFSEVWAIYPSDGEQQPRACCAPTPGPHRYG